MNKRTFFILALVVALALPTAAMAAAEFSLGGFIKLDAFWDSTQEGKNMNTLILRNNVATDNHGRLKFTSQGSRFNFTIKGPKLWGATTTGFIEMDFDSAGDMSVNNNAATTSNSYIPRLRHAMFRMNWPETELLFGQYWTFLTIWYPEVLQDGPAMITGTPTARIPQIRLTQKFLGAWTAGILVGEANGITDNRVYGATAVDHTGGESTEAPQVQAQLEYKQDLWGKAAWYGKPTPFTAQLSGGWQRGIIPVTAAGLDTTGENTAAAIVPAYTTRQTYVDPWIVMGSLFIPVIPTHSANLAGTASLQTSWWIGQGVEAFGFTTFGSQVFRFVGYNAANAAVYDVNLMNRFGGQVQAQYYFNNQWYVTGFWGFSKAIGVGAFERENGAPNNKAIALSGSNATANYHHEFDLALWYRPIQAFKFGLQYAYARTNWFQNVSSPANGVTTNLGEAHRVEFVGLFFF
ncbi:MAG: hypothetical protein AB1424_09540 [Thermodesulfobacteriota bacterium]